ncbi:MAG: TldD/PmbA family protein [Thermoleophilia bacterium]|nr:TldD/PmbA family protein [Thermoleophilia bacterium]
MARKALAHASRTGAGQAEAFALVTRSLRIKVYRQDVEELASATGSGVGVRVFSEDGVGYAYTTDLSEAGLEEAARHAAANAAVTAGDEFMGLPEPAAEFPELDLYAEKLNQTGVQEKIGLAAAMERAALESDKRVAQVEAAVYAEGEGRVAIANSLGFARQYRETSCYAYAQAVAEQEGQMQIGISFTTGREPGQLEGPACGREAAARAVALLGATQCQSLSCPVVMDPFVTAGLVGVVASALNGEAVQKQRSILAGKEGQAVASEAVRLVDEGTHPDGLASAPFDGEGVPTRRTVLVDNGILQGFLYDSYTGRKAGKSSTGNGVRGSYRSMPHVGATNLRLIDGTRPLQEMIASVDLGLYVSDVSGIHSGANPVSGDFSVGAAGVLIRGGELAEPVKEVTIAGNLLSILGSIEAVGNDNRWVPFGGSIHAPSLLIGEMTVSGK